MTEQEIELALAELQKEEDEIKQKKRDLHKHLSVVKAESRVEDMFNSLSESEKHVIVKLATLNASHKSKPLN